MDKLEQSLNKSSVNKDIVLPSPHWHVVQRYKWRIFLLSAFVSLSAALYLSKEQPLYRASATLLIEANQAQAVSFDSVQGLDSNRKEYYLTQFEILKSKSIAETRRQSVPALLQLLNVRCASVLNAENACASASESETS